VLNLPETEPNLSQNGYPEPNIEDNIPQKVYLFPNIVFNILKKVYPQREKVYPK
jgi:hypothetical protein